MKSLQESLLDDEDVIVGRLNEVVLIKEWLKKYDIRNYKINNDNTIDVNGDIDLNHYSKPELPSYIQFNIINGIFTINHSKLKTLRGCPQEVTDIFQCMNCTSLKTLEGGPKKVGGEFNCSYCTNLTSLKGAPKEVGSFYCEYNNSLKTLEGGPITASYYHVDRCGKLTSLEGCPKVVKYTFTCIGCTSLTSLEGGPKKVGDYYSCHKCNSLTSVKGLPKTLNRLTKPEQISKREILDICNIKFDNIY